MNIELGIGWLQIICTLKSHLERTKFCACYFLREIVTACTYFSVGRYWCSILDALTASWDINVDRKPMNLVTIDASCLLSRQCLCKETQYNDDKIILVLISAKQWLFAFLKSMLELWNFLSIISSTIRKKKTNVKGKSATEPLIVYIQLCEGSLTK